jgi:hypothetical protein
MSALSSEKMRPYHFIFFVIALLAAPFAAANETASAPELPREIVWTKSRIVEQKWVREEHHLTAPDKIRAFLGYCETAPEMSDAGNKGLYSRSTLKCTGV